jgi:hypothetical protein
VGPLEEREGGIDERIKKQRLAQGDIEGHRGLRRAGQVVAGLHDAREHPHDFGPALSQIGDDDPDARENRALTPIFQPRARPLRRGLDLLLGGWEGSAHASAIETLRHAGAEFEILKKLLRLRRNDVEGVGDEELRLLQPVEEPGHQVGQTRGVDFLFGLALILLAPPLKSETIFAGAAGADAPLVHEAPRFAALRGRARDDEEPAFLEDLLPQVLLLRLGEEQRQGLAQVGIERVLPQALDEGAEREDVRRLPDGQVFPGLKVIEPRHERLREALVRRDDRDPLGMALLQAGEKIGGGKRRRHAASLVH